MHCCDAVLEEWIDPEAPLQDPGRLFLCPQSWLPQGVWFQQGFQCFLAAGTALGQPTVLQHQLSR